MLHTFFVLFWIFISADFNMDRTLGLGVSLPGQKTDRLHFCCIMQNAG